MNTLTLQKQAQKEVTKLEEAIKSASRTLLEFEIAQSEWDIKQGRVKEFTAKSLSTYMRRKLKS